MHKNSDVVHPPVHSAAAAAAARRGLRGSLDRPVGRRRFWSIRPGEEEERESNELSGQRSLPFHSLPSFLPNTEQNRTAQRRTRQTPARSLACHPPNAHRRRCCCCCCCCCCCWCSAVAGCSCTRAQMISAAEVNKVSVAFGGMSQFQFPNTVSHQQCSIFQKQKCSKDDQKIQWRIRRGEY